MTAVTDFIAQLKGARVSPNIEPMRGDVDNFVLALQELSAPVENNQAANTFYAGPTIGAAAAPTFRTWSVNDPSGWGFTAGSIPFMTATGIAQNNANFFWNDVKGSLGIGTANPGSTLSVLGANTNIGSGANGTGMVNISIMTSDSAAVDVGGSLGLGGNYFTNTAQPFVAIAGRKANTTNGDAKGYLSLYTNDNSSLKERMRIDNFGNVGMGTTSPSILLDVAGPIGAKVYTVATLSSATVRSGQFAFVSDATLTASTGLGLVPTGGGTNFVSVYSDGTNWRII